MSSRRRFRSQRWIKVIGFVVGLVVSALAVLGWRIPAGDGTLGADLIFTSGPNGELSVSPVGPFITVAGLEPSGDADGELEVRNQTGSRIAVRPRVVADNRDLDRVLRIDVKAEKKLLFSGFLGKLRQGTPRALLLAPGETRPLTFRAWLPASTRKGYQGRIASVTVDFRVRPVKS